MIDPALISIISAATALTASITGPMVSLYVARAQIRAAVRSTNRQRWIEEFRETIARFSGQVAVATQLRNRIVQNGTVSVSADGDLHHSEQLITTATKIRLLTNPLDREHHALVTLVDDVLKLFRTADKANEGEVQAKARATVHQIGDVTLTIIRQEWIRVQRGV